MVIEEIKEWLEFLFVKNSPGRIGAIIRRIYWGKNFAQGQTFSMSYGCCLKSPGNISLGKDVKIMHNCCLYANNNGSIKIGNRASINCNVIFGASDNGRITIGNDVSIGPNVVLRASNHRYIKKDITINRQGHTAGKIIVEDDVWIGANVVILPEVTIGKGAVIGAGTVVNKNIPAYSLAAGVPVGVIKENCRI